MLSKFLYCIMSIMLVKMLFYIQNIASGWIQESSMDLLDLFFMAYFQHLKCAFYSMYLCFAQQIVKGLCI